LQGIIAGHYCRALLQGIISGHYSRALFQGIIPGLGRYSRMIDCSKAGLQGVITWRYCIIAGHHCMALLRCIIDGQYCGALLQGIIAGHYCNLQGIIAGHYWRALLQGRGVIAGWLIAGPFRLKWLKDT
jgi:hypothetical protein